MGGVVHGVKGGSILVEAPKLYEDRMAVSADYCYVAKTMPSRLAKRKTDALFVICEGMPENAPKRIAGNILFFSVPQSLRRVMNNLLDVFTKYNQWADALHAALLESESVHALLKPSLPIFENPLFLINSRFFQVAAASPDDPDDYISPILKVDDAWIIRGKDELLGKVESNKPFFRHLAEDYPRLFINIAEGDYLLGNLSIQASHRALRESDEYLLEQLAAVVRTAMLRSAFSDNNWRSRLEGMLSEIISGHSVNEEEFSQTLSYFGYRRGDQFRCLAIRLPKPSGKEFVRNFLQLLGTQIPTMYIPLSGEIVAMIMSASSAGRQDVGPLSLMEEKLNSLGFRVGASDEYSDLLLSQYYFAQARYALVCGEVTQAGKSVALFSDYCLDYILENVSGGLQPNMIWSEGFRKLVAHDVNGRANYVETLRAYLDNNLNAHRAASKLYISRNSLLSQLERIQSLLGEDLADFKVRFRYELSLLLYDKWKGSQQR